MLRVPFCLIVGLIFINFSLIDIQVNGEVHPSESECRPYIEKAIHELQVNETDDNEESNNNDKSFNGESLSNNEVTNESEENVDIENVSSEEENHITSKEDTNENSEAKIIQSKDSTQNSDEDNNNQIEENNDVDEDDTSQSQEDKDKNTMEENNENDTVSNEDDNSKEEIKLDKGSQETHSDENEEHLLNKNNDKDSNQIKLEEEHTKIHYNGEGSENHKNESNSEEIEIKESFDNDNNEEEIQNDDDDKDNREENNDETKPEDDLLLEGERPEHLRSRDHINQLLQLGEEYNEREKSINRVADIILRDLKRIYENAIKPLETLYKYRDLSNRHFGDPEILSKPLILFMGPWSGGKSTILNYLTDNEYTDISLKTGAEPSPAYFNILMYGKEPEILDGTQLAADWTFSGLQKFGQGLEDRLRGLKLPSKLLEKVNIVEIPGILEVRKHVSRLFPFNDACQWFIDRADIIFLVYDPSKLDIGPETEAILDQLKGREYQTRIILNKADQVKPEELLRLQSALIWNISPLMSSAQPPIMYTTSLWSSPYETSSPIRLLQAHEKAFLKDIRTAIDSRIEHKISSARRFAVRVRNHAKMVDCYLTTFYNHKTLFGNKRRISNEIIEHPQNYHIYEGLSTLTNISRYDLPDPEVYRDFFHLNPLYEFKKLTETCTYFRGCPINKLDIAIAYDLPELVGKYKKMTDFAVSNVDNNTISKQTA